MLLLQARILAGCRSRTGSGRTARNTAASGSPLMAKSSSAMVQTLAECAMRRVRKASRPRSWFTYQTSLTCRPPSGSDAFHRIQPDSFVSAGGRRRLGAGISERFLNNGAWTWRRVIHWHSGLPPGASMMTGCFILRLSIHTARPLPQPRLRHDRGPLLVLHPPESAISASRLRL